jgi:hypothetical protein
MKAAMRVCSLAAFVAVILVRVSTAHADGKGDIEKKIKEAMESYDLMDYDASKKLLNQALATAKKSHLDKDPVSAHAYLDLGIVSFVNNDQDGAKLSFLSACQIDPKIQIDAAYKSPEMSKLLEQARGEAKGSGGNKSSGGESFGSEGGNEGGVDLPIEGGGDADCKTVKGLQHELIDTAKGGAPLQVSAMLGSDVHASKVSVMYRPEGATNFTEVKMSKQGGCKYVAQIPASGMHGSLVHYYVAAYGDNGKPVASKGSAGSPNIMELTGGGKAAGGGDEEDPLGNGKKTVAQAGGDESGGEVSKDNGGETGGSKKTHVMLSASVGSGFGYIGACPASTGQPGCTEGGNPVKAAGLGPSWFVVTPELDYVVNPHIAIGGAVRIGVPFNANYNGHATLAPSFLARVRYTLDSSGNGVRVMGQVGYGIIRNTVALDNSSMGNVDIVASGPLLLGGGVGYVKPLGSTVKFVVDASLLAAINTGGANMMGDSSVTGAPLNSSVTVDVAIGLALGL